MSPERDDELRRVVGRLLAAVELLAEAAAVLARVAVREGAVAADPVVDGWLPQVTPVSVQLPLSRNA